MEAEVTFQLIEVMVEKEEVTTVVIEEGTTKICQETEIDEETTVTEEEEDSKEEEVLMVEDKVEEWLEEEEEVEGETLQAKYLKIRGEALLQDLVAEIIIEADFMKIEEGEEEILIKTMMNRTDLKDLEEIQQKIIQRDFEEGKIHIGSLKIKVNNRWNHQKVAAGGNARGRWIYTDGNIVPLP